MITAHKDPLLQSWREIVVVHRNHLMLYDDLRSFRNETRRPLPGLLQTAFQAAVDAKVAGIMPCYSRPSAINAKQTYRGVDINPASLGSAYNPTILQTLLRDTMVSCSEVIDTVPTVIDGVEYDICVSPNDVPGYDKDQYIDADILAKSPSGSYAYKDADGNVYKAWFGLSFE